MNHIYRLVWNVRTATFVAASEITPGRGKSGSVLMSGAFLLTLAQTFFHPAWGADITVANGNTRVFNALNGVQVIDIATSNAAGLSHNRYTQFNVAPGGLILNNNSPQTGAGSLQTQLGGKVVPNMNLAAEARVILNEVVAANRSVLAGYMEVAGGRADVIVANPWGITCRGCGFINSDRATLTTGVPQTAGDGSLSGFRVNQGDILVEGNGLDGRDQNILDLVARSVQFDGQINAKDLQVVAGRNDYAYATRNATPIANVGSVPTYAIDSTALGGMYAHRIRLIATENGVGVRKLGEAAATADDFTITAAGKIEIRGKLSAERDLAITYSGPAGGGAAALELAGVGAELAAKRDIALAVQNGAGATFSDGKITAGQDLTLTAGSLTDSSSASATRFAARNNTVTTSGAASVDRPTWGAGGKLSMTMSSLTIGGHGATLYSGADAGAANRDLELVTTAGDLDLAGIDLKAGGNLTLGGASTGQFVLGAGGSLKAGGTLTVSANDQISVAGSMLAGDSLVLKAADGLASLSNSGTLQASNVVTLGAVGHLLDLSNQAGGVILGDTLNLRADDIINAGSIQASHGSTVNAASFSNSGASAKFLASTSSGSDASLVLSGAFANQGILQSAGALALTSGGALTNSGSVLALHAPDGSGAALTLSALTIDNSGTVDGGGGVSASVTATTGDSFVNSGAIQGGGNIALSVGNKLWNQAAGKIVGDAAVTITSGNAAFTLDNDGLLQSTGNLVLGEVLHLASLDNASTGLIRSDASLAFVGGSLLNAGTLQTASGATLSGTTFSNTGVNSRFLASTTAGSDGSLTFSGAVSNQGTLQSAGGLALTSASTLSNSGTIKASGASDNLTVSATTLSNTGYIEAGDLLSLTATATTGTTVSNSGQIHSVDTLALVTGGDVSNTGSLIGDAALSISSGQAGFNLINSGRLQSGAALTLGEAGHVVALNNQAAGVVFAGSTLSLSGGALSNAGTIQATSGTSTVSGGTFSNSGTFLVSTAAGSDGNLTFSGTITNTGTLQSAGGLSLTGSSTLANSGTIKASGASDTLALSATTLGNTGNIEAGDILNLTATATSGTTVSNSGQIHSVDTLALVTGGDVSNTGSLIGDAALSITTGQASYALSNSGRLQSGAALTLGEAGHVVALNNQAAGVVFAGSTLSLSGGALNNQGKIYANTGTTMNLSSLANGDAGNSGALIFGAMIAGNSSSINVSGALDNYGAIHSSDSLTLTAAGITNRSTGGLSSLATLGLTSSGGNNIDNYGALYAGTALNLTAAGGSIFNRAATGTIDSNGTLTTNSVNFTNNNTVVATGDISITTSGSFINETTLAGGVSITKIASAVGINQRNFVLAQTLLTEGGAYAGADIKVMRWDFDREDLLNGISSADLLTLPKAQIIANGAGSSLSINYGGSGRNYLAVISAPTVNIGGSGTFTNEDLALYRVSYATQFIEVHDDYVGAGSGKKKYEFWGRDNPSANYSTNVDGDHDEWGQYHPGGGWSRFNHGDTSETWASAQGPYNDARGRSEDSGAVLSGAVTMQSFGAGIYGGTVNFTSGTLSNVGSPWPNDPAQAKAGGAKAGGLDTLNQSNGTSSSASGVSGASAGGAGSASGVSGAGVTGAGGKSSVVAGAPLSFAGLNLTLPSNPNGYFVPSRDPSALYLVETNPLFAVGSNFVGSNYLAERYGVNPDTVQKRLGDSNYEAYLIRQQLIQQSGSNVLKGYGDEASQMKRLMDQSIQESLAFGAKDVGISFDGQPGAVTSSQSQGFVFGKELSAEQITGLTKDIVWMVEVEVAGQKVLAPRVYLAQSTRDMIVGGAAIAGDNVNIAGDALNNTGGTIRGSDTLKVTVKGDITNTSGNIQGGEVSLTSTEGSIVNQTLATGAGNDTQYETAIGKTAGITSTGKMDLTAEKNITVVGADIKADGGLDMLAGEKIEITEIVDKTITSSSSTTTDAENFLISDDTTTTNSTKTTEKGKGSSVTVGTKEQKLALEKARTDLQAQEAKTSAARKEVVEINSLINKDPSSIARAEVSARIKAALKSDADALLALLERINPKPPEAPAEVPVVVNIPERTAKEELAYRKLSAEGKIAADAARANSFKQQGSDISIEGGINKREMDKEPLSDTAILALKQEFNAKLAAYKLKAQEVEDANPMPAKSEAVLKLEAERQVKLDAYTALSAEAVVLQAKVDEASKKTGGLTVKAESMTVKGSSMSVAGDAKFNIDKDLEILSGTDKESETITKVKTAYFTTDSEDDQEKLNKEAPSSNSDAKHNAGVSASASADAKAETGHESNLEFASTETTTTQKSKSTNVASKLDIGGNLDMKAGSTLKIQGSDLNVLGDASLEATDIKVLAGVNTETETTKTEKTGVGIYNEENASAEAEAKAKGTLHGAHASAGAGAEASADHTTTIGVQTTSTSDEYSNKTHTASTLSAGGNLKIKAKNTATFQGANVEAGNDLDIEATDIRNLAAVDEETRKTSSSTSTSGLYLSAEAEAEANAKAKASPTGVGVDASAEAKAEAGAGLRTANQSETTDTGSTHNVTNTFKAGGDLTRKATNTIEDQGTNLEAGGNIEQSATRLIDTAISDTVWSNKKSDSYDARIGASAQVGAEAGANASAGVSGTDVGAKAEVEASVGVKASLEMKNEESEKKSTTAVVSKYKAGGGIKSTTTEETVLNGTQFEAGGDIELNAKSLTFNAAENTTTETSGSYEGEGEAKMKLVGTVGGEAEASYEQEKARNKTSTTVVGSITSTGGGIKINTKDDAKFEGTAITAETNVSIKSETGSVTFDAAEDTSTSSESGFAVAANLKAGAGGGPEAGASGGYNEHDANKVDKKVATIKSKSGGVDVSAEKTVSFEGTQIESKKDTTITANEVKLLEAKNVDQESGFGIQANANLSAESQSGGLDVSVLDSDKQTGNATSLNTGGKLVIDAKKTVSQGAEYDASKTTITGQMENIEKTNIDKVIDVEASLDVSRDSSDKKKKEDANKKIQESDKKISEANAEKNAAGTDAKKQKAADDKKDEAKKRKAAAEKDKADVETREANTAKEAADTKKKVEDAPRKRDEAAESLVQANENKEKAKNQQAAATKSIAEAVAMKAQADQDLAAANQKAKEAIQQYSEAKTDEQKSAAQELLNKANLEAKKAIDQSTQAAENLTAAEGKLAQAGAALKEATEQGNAAAKNKAEAEQTLMAAEDAERTEMLKAERGEKIKTTVKDSVEQAEALEEMKVDELREEVRKQLNP